MNTDRSTVRLIVFLLGCVAIVSLGLIGALAMMERAIPDALISLGSAAAGALGSMLAKTSTELAAVNVVNSSAAPVPVDPTG